MIVPSTKLFSYICKQFAKNILFLLGALLALVYVLDTIEILRQSASREGLPVGIAMMMAALKLPVVGQQIIPFGVLFAAIYTCWKLNRTQELVVIRAAGLSVWQFLNPMIFSALVFGILTVGLINPLSAMMVGKYEQMETIYLNKSDNIVTVSRTGIWLRQPAGNDGGYSLLHASSFDQNEWHFSDVLIMFFAADDSFVKRIDSPEAFLKDGYWDVQSALINDREGATREARMQVETNLTSNKIEESFSDPETISFWKIPEYLRIMEETGFPTSALHIHFQAMLAKPFLLAAMVLLAAAFSLRPTRFSGGGMLITLGVAAGFFIFFMESMLQAFGISQKIPVILAAWTPAIVTLLVGVTALLHLEDG